MAKSRTTIQGEIPTRFVTGSPENITALKHRDQHGDVVEAMEHIDEGSRQGMGTAILFDWVKGYIHNETTPMTGDFTFNSTNAKVGAWARIKHNDSSVPTLPVEAVDINDFAVNYIPNQDNHIYCVCVQASPLVVQTFVPVTIASVLINGTNPANQLVSSNSVFLYHFLGSVALAHQIQTGEEVTPGLGTAMSHGNCGRLFDFRGGSGDAVIEIITAAPLFNGWFSWVRASSLSGDVLTLQINNLTTTFQKTGNFAFPQVVQTNGSGYEYIEITDEVLYCVAYDEGTDKIRLYFDIPLASGGGGGGFSDKIEDAAGTTFIKTEEVADMLTAEAEGERVFKASASLSAILVRVGDVEENVNSTYIQIDDANTLVSVAGGPLRLDELGATVTDPRNPIAINANGDIISDTETPKNNWTAGSAPTVNDDSGDGFSVGSMWKDNSASPDVVYICADPTVAAAVWFSLTEVVDLLDSSGLSGGDITNLTTISNFNTNGVYTGAAISINTAGLIYAPTTSPFEFWCDGTNWHVRIKRVSTGYLWPDPTEYADDAAAGVGGVLVEELYVDTSGFVRKKLT